MRGGKHRHLPTSSLARAEKFFSHRAAQFLAVSSLAMVHFQSPHSPARRTAPSHGVSVPLPDSLIAQPTKGKLPRLPVHEGSSITEATCFPQKTLLGSHGFPRPRRCTWEMAVPIVGQKPGKACVRTSQKKNG